MDNDVVIWPEFSQSPEDESERALSSMWSDVFNIERLDRDASFFALGGNSVQAIQTIEGLYGLGFILNVRDLYETPVLFQLASALKRRDGRISSSKTVPSESISSTPNEFPSVASSLSEEMDYVAAHVEGGASNVEDIYPLSPSQNGFLFRHLSNPRSNSASFVDQKTFGDRKSLDAYVAALQKIVDRHTSLRTSFVWQDVSSPVQVVWRRATVTPEEVTLSTENGSPDEQLAEFYRSQGHGMDLRRAPLVRILFSKTPNSGWTLLQTIHHIVSDHTTLALVREELRSILSARIDQLPTPIPFRQLIDVMGNKSKQDTAREFFTEMLGDINEPTFPFDLTEECTDESRFVRARRVLPNDLTERLRDQARKSGSSLATLCHVAFGQVVARTSQRDKVVFGTVITNRFALGDAGSSAIGMYVNALPIRVDVDGRSVKKCILDVQSRLGKLLECIGTSNASARICSGVPRRIPLFSALMSYKSSVDLPRDPNSSGSFSHSLEHTEYPLTLTVNDRDSVINFTVKVIDSVDSNRLCDYFIRAVESLVEALSSDPETTSIESLEILPEAELKMLLTAWNTPEIPGFEPPCLHRIFERVVERTPEAVALVCENETWTYARMNARANQLAHRLIALGVRPEKVVTICMDRSTAMVIGMMAVVKAGGVYAPMDPACARDLLIHVLHNTSPVVLLADSAGRAALGEEVLPRFTVLDPNVVTDGPETNPEVEGLTSRNMLYVIHTSGSTGTPKGVEIEHRNIVWLLESTESLFDFRSNDVWSLVHSFAFDFSVWEIWATFRYGSTLAIVPMEIQRSPPEFHRYICAKGVTVLNKTCSAFKDFVDCYSKNPIPDRLRYVIFAGEAFDPAVLKSWYEVRQRDLPKLVNMYGVTETSVFVTYAELTANNAERLVAPIGKSLPRCSLHVLDPRHRLVPFGIAGELYVGGTAVCRGYRNKPDMNAERFLPDPFSITPGARLYKTGDVVRYLPDGDLVFVTRNDHQIKFNGFRIEAADIEACLQSHPKVREALVMTRGCALFAYVLTDSSDKLANELRTYLSGKLPSYMVPHEFVMLKKFPVSTNGKLNRLALPVSGQTKLEYHYEAPKGPIEEAVASVWTTLFDVEKIDRKASFFELGGDSLAAVRMVGLLSAVGIDLSLTNRFATKSLIDLAETIEDEMKNV